MAKQVGIYQYKGRLGEAVGFGGRRGMNHVRVRTMPRNPRTAAQSIQRMIAATCSVSMSYLTEILSNSIQGKSTGQPTLDIIRSTWMNMLRSEDCGQVPSTHSYNPIGTKLFMPNKYLLSRGTLGSPSFSIETESEGLNASFKLNSKPLGTMDDGRFSQMFLGVELGYQITIVVSSYNFMNGDVSSVDYCRFAFANDTEPAFVLDDGAYKLNPAALDLTKVGGKWEDLQFFMQDGYLMVYVDALMGQPYITGGAIIISSKEKQRRSTSYLIPYETNWSRTYFAGGNVYSTYMNGTTVVDVPSDVYLDNSTIAEPVDPNLNRNARCDLPIILAANQQGSIDVTGLTGNITEATISFYLANGEQVDAQVDDRTTVGQYLIGNAEDGGVVVDYLPTYNEGRWILELHAEGGTYQVIRIDADCADGSRVFLQHAALASRQYQANIPVEVPASSVYPLYINTTDMPQELYVTIRGEVNGNEETKESFDIMQLSAGQNVVAFSDPNWELRLGHLPFIYEGKVRVNFSTLTPLSATILLGHGVSADGIPFTLVAE